MQVLLPPKHFGKSIELQPIEENEEYLPNTKIPNPVGQPDPVGQTESNEKDSTLPEQVMQANQKENLYTSICAYLKDLGVHAKPEGVKLKDCRVNKNLLMQKDQLWMPNNKDLRLEVIKKTHDQPAISYPGVEKTLNMIRRHYYWPHMQQTIEQYVWNCHVCRRVKVAHDIYNSLLQPLLVLKRLWVNVTIDFVTGLPKCHAYS